MSAEHVVCCCCVSAFYAKVGVAFQVLVASGDRVLGDSVTTHGAFMTPSSMLIHEVKQVSGWHLHTVYGKWAHLICSTATMA